MSPDRAGHAGRKKSSRRKDKATSSTSHISGYLSEWSETETNLVPYSLTSRLSPNTVCDIVDSFGEYKRWLVMESGFGGTLSIRRQKKINLKFSEWLMKSVDCDARHIELPNSTYLPFWDADVHKVLGVPHGPRHIRSEVKVLNTEGVDFIRSALGMNNSSENESTLKAAERFLMKNISSSSSKMEKDCFKIAYVIFVVGHFLAPGTKHDHSKIDYWHAIADADNIEQYNWCGYIIEDILKSVKKLKQDKSKNMRSFHLSSCHLFLQVFYLDNLDLGELNKKHDTMPRIDDFPYDHMKRLINMAASVGVDDSSYTAAMLRPAGLVLYTRTQHQVTGPTKTLSKGVSPDLSTPNAHLPTMATPVALHTEVPIISVNRSAHTPLGPMDFSRYLTSAHPQLAFNGMSPLLREYMARQVQNTTNMRNNQIKDMMDFADKLANRSNQRCICCEKRGFDDCMMKLNSEAMGNAKSCYGRHLDMGKEEGKNLSPTSSSRKRGTKVHLIRQQKSKNCVTGIEGHRTSAFRTAAEMLDKEATSPHQTTIASSHESLHPPMRCPIREMCENARSMVDLIKIAYEEDGRSPGHVFFGGIINANHEKTSFPVDIPWANNWFPRKESYFHTGPRGLNKLFSYISNLQVTQVSTIWVSHEFPRLINITGIALRKQLVGNQAMDHEVCAIIIRRMMQINIMECKLADIAPWSCYLEPDFAVNAVAGNDCSILSSCRNQFVRADLTINSCWLFHAPLILPDGWCNFAFEMPNKVIYIMDPTAGPRGMNQARKKKLDVAADLILNALFECIRKFFLDWPVNDVSWTKRFPILMDSHYSRDQSGICATFFVKNFGGQDMKVGISKDNIHEHRHMIMHQVMRTDGSTTNIAKDHLLAAQIDASSDSD